MKRMKLRVQRMLPSIDPKVHRQNPHDRARPSTKTLPRYRAHVEEATHADRVLGELAIKAYAHDVQPPYAAACLSPSQENAGSNFIDPRRPYVVKRGNVKLKLKSWGQASSTEASQAPRPKQPATQAPTPRGDKRGRGGRRQRRCASCPMY